MSKYFSPLLFHARTDIHPRTWVCIHGPGLALIFRNLENEARSRSKLRRTNLAIKISSKFKCSTNTIGRILSGNTKFYPIPIVLELLSLVPNQEKYAREIDKTVELLKVNSASAKPIKFPREMNPTLAKIIVAFMADGSLSVQVVIADSKKENLNPSIEHLKKSRVYFTQGYTLARNQHYLSCNLNKDNQDSISSLILKISPLTKVQIHYNLELVEEYQDSVEIFARWLSEEFGIQPTNFNRKKGAWRVIFSNKILARYLNILFGIYPGPKTFDAWEPDIIAKSDLKIRKAFAQGVLIFDGCVTKSGRVSLSVKSKRLCNSISDIWTKDGIFFGKNKVNKRGEHVIFSLSKNNPIKLLEYFDESTQKAKMLNWVNGIKSGKEPSIKTSDKFVSTIKILDLLKETNKCDTEFLKKHFKVSHATVRTYLKILSKQNQILLNSYPNGLSDSSVDTTTSIFLKDDFHNVLFIKVKEKLKKFNSAANFLMVRKATISAWKLKKNRIPLSFLKDMCDLTGIDYEEALANVINTDREIAQII